MGTMKNLLILIALAASILFSFYLFFRGTSAWSQHYPWRDMDWNGSGTTSLAEFFEASDVGKRVVTKDGSICIEYFRYKDGLPIKVVCKR